MRRAYIDWLRGIAVLAMIEWHVIDAWSVRGDRETPAWFLIEFIGGFAAPLFLFLAGLAVPFAIAAKQRKGAGLGEAAWSVQKRGWEVFGIALLFKLYSFLLNPSAPWSYLIKPDILNILGLGLAATSWLYGRVSRSVAGRVSLLLTALAIAAITPWSKLWWWPTLLYPRLEAYIRPVGTLGVFSLFPWFAFVPLGAFIGALIAGTRDDATETRVLGWIGAIGLLSGAAGLTGFWMDPARPETFWLGAYADFAFKSGVMLTMLTVSKWVVRIEPASVTRAMVLFGQTSLFVYLVHVELAYGVWSIPLHSALPLPWSVAGFAAMVAAMYFAARWWAGRPSRPWIPPQLISSHRSS